MFVRAGASKADTHPHARTMGRGRGRGGRERERELVSLELQNFKYICSIYMVCSCIENFSLHIFPWFKAL